MIDGIDGSGKSTVLEAWKNQLAGEGHAIFDLKNYWQTQKNIPCWMNCVPTILFFLRTNLRPRRRAHPSRTHSRWRRLPLACYRRSLFPGSLNFIPANHHPSA